LEKPGRPAVSGASSAELFRSSPWVDRYREFFRHPDSHEVFDRANVLNFKGQTIRLRFITRTDSSLPTSFFIDDVALMADGN
jgi:hypothetical protein